MSIAPAPSTKPRKSIFLPTLFAGTLCLLALAALVFLPASFRHEEKDYFGGNGPKIASISINAFVAEYQQRTQSIDCTDEMAKQGFSTVNTVEWSIQSRRVAAVLAIPAILLVVRVVRRTSSNAS